MLNRFLYFLSFFSFCISPVSAQEINDTTGELIDEIVTLDEVSVQAFGAEQVLTTLPAAANKITSRMMERFAPFSILNAVNSSPGVRMEERSPGSYRINIRGSSLRSPFGVRNVKVYFNDIPITNPGGLTFLNQLGSQNFGSIDIIKGPGSSFYGAGTGGVMLINNHLRDSGILASYTEGSYGSSQTHARIITHKNNFASSLSYERLTTDGFRDHSEMKKDVLTWQGSYRLSKTVLKTTFLYGDMFYETPGALTRAGYLRDPKASRPGTPAFPSAIAANASVRQRSFISGLTLQQSLSGNWKNKSTAYAMFTELKNPNIQNYDKSTDPHFGGRTEFQYQKQLAPGIFSFDLGSEYQYGFTNVTVYKNKGGIADSLRSTDEIGTRQALVFAQARWHSSGWLFTAGMSLNFLRFDFTRHVSAPVISLKKDFTNQVAPRVAVMKKFSTFNIYSSVSKGFSPPSTSEFFPTGNDINISLNAETGINYDIGLKGHFLHNLMVDLNAFVFSLKNTIVQRRTAGGGDFYTNAGKTTQKGIETMLSYPYHKGPLTRTFAWLSHSFHDFKYNNFQQFNADYSGRRLPSEPVHSFSAGVDRELLQNFNAVLSWNYTGEIAMNDSNTVYAEPYHLVTAKLAYSSSLIKNIGVKISGGVENLLDETYSLGNDVNAFGGRYFNAAPGRSFFLTVAFTLKPRTRNPVPGGL